MAKAKSTPSITRPPRPQVQRVYLTLTDGIDRRKRDHLTVYGLTVSELSALVVSAVQAKQDNRVTSNT